jgi:hypothetical protein
MKDFEATEAWPLYQSRFAYFSRIKVNKIHSFFQFQKRRSTEERIAILSLSLSLSLSPRNPSPLPPRPKPLIVLCPIEKPPKKLPKYMHGTQEKKANED